VRRVGQGRDGLVLDVAGEGHGILELVQEEEIELVLRKEARVTISNASQRGI
jgi:hypothetical protein